MIVSARTIDNNVDATPPTITEVVNVSVGHASKQELLVSNKYIQNSMNVLPATISEVYA